MKVIRFVNEKCPCIEKINKFMAELQVSPQKGTIVECDCGSRYRMGQVVWIQVEWSGVAT